MPIQMIWLFCRWKKNETNNKGFLPSSPRWSEVLARSFSGPELYKTSAGGNLDPNQAIQSAAT